MHFFVVLFAAVVAISSAKIHQKSASQLENDYGDGGVKSCPALHLKGNVTVTPPTCRNGAQPSGTTCHFHCNKGYRVRGPPMTMCQDDGTWFFGHREISCADVDECKFRNGGCSHKCHNEEGDYHCDCPAPLELARDRKTCRAVGLVLNCSAHDIEVIIPKYALNNLEGDYVQLRDPSCHPRENKTHYIFKTALNGCGTTRRHTRHFLVYSNKVTERHVTRQGVITRIGEDEFNIPFCCYYLDNAIVGAVGYKPFVRELVLKEKGFGNFKLRMDFYSHHDYKSLYTWDDFPVSVYLRQRLYFEVSIDSIDQDLIVFAGNCCATPTRDHEKAGKVRHELIHEGCIDDSTTKAEYSPSPHKQRFSVEAFKFVGKFPFVYLHCSVIVCKAGDPNSRCAKGCIPGLHRGKPMNGPYAKHGDSPQLDSKAANEKSDSKAANEKSDSKAANQKSDSKAANQKSDSKATNQKSDSKAANQRSPVRHTRSIPENAVVKKEKEHKYMLSKGPVSLIEDEPEVVRDNHDGKEPDIQQPNDDKLNNLEENVDKDQRDNADKTSVGSSTSNALILVLIACTVLALVGVLYIGRKVKQATNRGMSTYKPMKS